MPSLTELLTVLLIAAIIGAISFPSADLIIHTNLLATSVKVEREILKKFTLSSLYEDENDHALKLSDGYKFVSQETPKREIAFFRGEVASPGTIYLSPKHKRNKGECTVKVSLRGKTSRDCGILR